MIIHQSSYITLHRFCIWFYTGDPGKGRTAYYVTAGQRVQSKTEWYRNLYVWLYWKSLIPYTTAVNMKSHFVLYYQYLEIEVEGI